MTKEENMPGRANGLLAIVGFALAIPVAAAQAPRQMTAFDGHYVGVSAHSSKISSSHDVRCPHQTAPEPLSITNGVVHSAGHYRWTGRVDPQGSVVLRNRHSMRVNGHIDPQGTLSGEYHGPVCIITYVWRKQSG
jgi:hypothetical protein